MITAIISTYNHCNYLEGCINAILQQGDLITKIIIINDASTDSTEELLDKIKSVIPKLFIIKNKQNIGAVASFKIGLEYVDSEFFTLLAADDILMPEWATCSLEAFRLSETASVCLSNTYIKNEDTGLITCTNMPSFITNRYLSPKKFCDSVIKYGVWYSSNTALYRMEKYDENSFQSEIGPLNDRLMISALGSKSGVVVVSKKLGCFYMRNQSMSGSVVSQNMSFKILTAFSYYLFSTNLFINIDKNFVVKIFISTFFVYINEHLNYVLKQYKNILVKMPDTWFAILNIILLNSIIIIFKVFSSLINKSLFQLLNELFCKSKLTDKEIIYFKEHEDKMKKNIY